MRTLLVDQPSLLSDTERSDLTDTEYCKKLGLRIGFGLIRKIECGKEVKGRLRYWKDRYGDFYVCSQWSRAHSDNAGSLLDFVEGLIQRNPEHEDALRPHAQAFHDYLEKNCA